ncbi:polysaccharide pyruvyl transferase family protein [bacterium]|nr:polysaccharide pyruvyl transferase family protein [bacterium]
MKDSPRDESDPSPPQQQPFSVVVYRVRNLGDMIQTAALSQWLPPSTGIFRHQLSHIDREGLFVVNGVLFKDRPAKCGKTCLFAGVSGPYWRKSSYFDWLASSPYPIGGRDQMTVDIARARGLDASLIGCATLTFPKYVGKRHGVYSVDYPGPGTLHSHNISRKDSVPNQWAAAMDALQRYRTAEAIYTTRLHVAFPCLAFGTPVYLANPQNAWAPGRFTVFEKLNLPYNELVTADVSDWGNRFVDFLRSHAKPSVDQYDTKMPSVKQVPLPFPAKLREWFRL